MANDNDNENVFHGYRFLVDVKNSRQYAIRYDNGAPKGVDLFAADARDKAIKPYETIFALEDEFEVESNIVKTVAFQITADETGTPKNIKASPITYVRTIVLDENDEPVAKYKMTQESVLALRQMGFTSGFPLEFRGAVPTDTAGRISPDTLDSLPFPPNHAGGAAIARTNVSKTTPRPVTPVFNPVVQPPKNYKIPDSAIEAVIRQYCKDLTAQAAEGSLDPVVGRDQETDQALKVLTRRKQSSLCFTGEAGVGKTAMFAAVAQRINDDPDLPGSLRGARVLELDLQAMNAGAKYRGQFEEKLKPLIDGLAEREGVLRGRKIVLAIDELHSQLTSGMAEGGSDAGNMMKPFLTSKGISVMGTTTDEEYKKHIEKDGALGRRFEKMRITPPDADTTVTIIRKLWPLIKAHNNLTEDLSEEQMRYVVTMSNRYAPQEAQPSKSEKVINMAAASAEFNHRTAISKEDILSAVAQMSNLSVDFLNQSDHERFLKMETELPKEVLGQPGLQRLVDGLIGSRSGLTDPNQPWGCFVLQGPTGTGKTETCKALARYLFGTEEALIKLDMSEYSEKHTVSRLIGAPPGYVGFDSAEPALTEKIRNRPYSILLLDEVEKAAPEVFNVLLSVLNDGKMTDNQGKTVLFNNVIIVMTTNAGAAAATRTLEGKSSMSLGGQGSETPEKTMEELKAIYEKARTLAAGGPFRPEMINRIEELGGFITFIPLQQEVITKLVTRELEKINERLASPAGANLPGVSVEITPDVMKQLAKEGYNPSMGARPLRKVVREKIANPLGKWLMGNKEKLQAFAAENGLVKIVIGSVDSFEPSMVKGEPANDNKKATRKKAAAPKP